MTDDRTSPRFDFTLDLRRDVGADPIVHLLDALDQLGAGQVLEVITDGSRAFRAVTDQVVARGHRVLGEPEHEDDRRVFLIEVGQDGPADPDRRRTARDGDQRRAWSFGHRS